MLLWLDNVYSYGREHIIRNYMTYFLIKGEDSVYQAAEYMSKVARILVKLQMYDEAADAIRREIGMRQQLDHGPSVGRLTVALVLVQLARADQVAAEKAFKEWGNYCETPEVQITFFLNFKFLSKNLTHSSIDSYIRNVITSL